MYGALLHKVVSIILMYGFDIVKILENLYYILLRITNLHLPINDLLIIVALAYATFGIVAAFVGRYIGKQLINEVPVTLKNLPQWTLKNDLFTINHFKYNSNYIIIHLIALILFLVALEIYPLSYSIIPVFLYLIFLYKRYGTSLSRLAKPVFWLQLLILILITIWLWDDKLEGLFVGIKMILRAILVVSIFTAISVELKNPLIKALLYKKGFSQFYVTLGIATSAVPFILKNISNDKKTLFNPFKVLRKAISLSDTLLQIFNRQIIQNNQIFVVSGPTQSGKTTYLNHLIKEIEEKRPELRLGGVIAHGIDLSGQRFGFKIEDIATGDSKFLSSIQNDGEDSIRVGRFYFSKEGLLFGQKALTNNLTDIDVLVIDEVGHLELHGKGWFEAIEKAMMQENLNIIMVVRESLLEEVLQLWQNKHFVIINVNHHDPSQIIQML
jgi:nucleoside-triphosphatase THEP1